MKISPSFDRLSFPFFLHKANDVLTRFQEHEAFPMFLGAIGTRELGIQSREQSLCISKSGHGIVYNMVVSSTTYLQSRALAK